MSLENSWKSRVKEIYRTSEVLDVKHAIHNEYSNVPIDFWGEIIKSIGIFDNATMLDVGCGTGELCDLIQKICPNSEVIGLDIASNVLQKVKLQTNSSISYLAGDAENLSFNDRSIDRVTAIHSLPYVRNIDRALSEISRVLNESGNLVVTANSLKSYPHVSKYREKIFSELGWGKPIFPSTYFNLENMNNILSNHFPVTTIATLQGKMSIPKDKFLPYFNANIDVWDHKVSQKEREQILYQVREWTEKDAKNDMIIEQKYVGVAVCKK